MYAFKRWVSVRNALMIGGALTTLAQASCGDDVASALGNLPATSPAQGYASYGPYMGEGPIPIGYPASMNDAYAWPERSYALDRVFYETPPDYGFNYGGTQPYAWRTANDWTRYADPVGERQRYYYYEPDAISPYFIRDNQYGYGFDNSGRLVSIFNMLGQLMPNSFLGQQAPVAGDYFRRAYEMRQYGLSADPVMVSEQAWQARERQYLDDQNLWLRAAQAEPWVEYRTRTDGQLIKAFEKEVKHRKQHPGFPAHAKGWGPPFLRDGDRRIAIASFDDPGVVVVERDRRFYERDDRRRFEARKSDRDDRDRGRDRADRGDDDRAESRGRDDKPDRSEARDGNDERRSDDARENGKGRDRDRDPDRAERQDRPQQQARAEQGKGRKDDGDRGSGKGKGGGNGKDRDD